MILWFLYNLKMTLIYYKKGTLVYNYMLLLSLVCSPYTIIKNKCCYFFIQYIYTSFLGVSFAGVSPGSRF